MTTLKDRLVYARKERGLSQASLAKFAQLSQAAIAAIETGRNKGSTAIATLASVLGVSPVWLETGRGEPFIADSLPEYAPPSSDTMSFDLYDIRASCGTGIINVDFPDFIRRIDIPKHHLNTLLGRKDMDGIQIICTNTDSMFPTIPRHALVFINVKINYFDGDGIYAFVLGEEAYIKRLQRLPGKFLAISDNDKYKPFEITDEMMDSFHVIAKFTDAISLEVISL